MNNLKLKQETKANIIITLIYKRLVIKTSNYSMYTVLKQLGWKINITEFGKLI